MKFLDEPIWNDVAAHHQASLQGNDRAATLRPLLQTMFDRFEEYRQIRTTHGEISESPIIDEGAKKFLISLYNLPIGPLKELKKLVRQVEEDYCAYCGGPSLPHDIDHALEKAIFPEFSMLSINLIHICRRCNASKMPRFSDSLRNFVMPYVDQCLKKITLSCEITIDHEYPAFSLVVAGDITQEERGLIDRHCRTFHISKNFPRWAYRRFNKMPKAWQDAQHEFNTLEGWLNRRLADSINIDGKNCWEAAFLRGLLADPGACGLLLHRAETT